MRGVGGLRGGFRGRIGSLSRSGPCRSAHTRENHKEGEARIDGTNERVAYWIE